jgi:flagellum-specific peptidoglycan hydrolase FlgJ
MTTPPTDAIAAAQSASRKWAIPASISLAQWALESGWGKHDLGACNFFGMKCRAGKNDPFVTLRTREVDRNGKTFFIDARFRKFASVEEAFDAHAQLLATAPVYSKARARLPDVAAFADALTGVYATDPKYGALLRSIIRGSDLTQYDKVHA